MRLGETSGAFHFGGSPDVLTVTWDGEALERALSDIVQRQMPFALSQALTDAAKDGREAAVAEMSRVFDRPTPFTLNAFEVKPARKDDLVAEVRQKASSGRRHYLRVEAHGGPRPQTALEKLLAMKLPFGGVLQAILPADNARLNQYGNWSQGQRNDVLSALNAQRDRWANRTADSQARKKARSKYFVPRSGLPPAVYERKASGQLGVVLAFTSKVPVYAERFPFERIVLDRAASVFPDHFARRMAAALATAR